MANQLLLSLEDVSLTFGGKPLFDGLTLYVNERDRICLVGKNGAGKTTLMKLICGELEVDSGKQFLLPGITVGYLAQQVPFDPAHSVREFVLLGLSEDNSDESYSYLADIVISPLQLNPDAPMGNLSGGQVRRAALARALVESPDILLLDEPTNHLDIETIEWLENYLQSYAGVLICISHDRQFLANISQKVFWIDQGQVKVCPFGYGKFEEWQEDYIAQEARALQNLQKKVDAEHGWTQGGVSGRRKRNVRRLNELSRMRDKLKSDKAAYNKRSQKITMDALDTPNASKIICEFKQVSKQFQRGDETIRILDNFSHLMLKKDRVGILGKNGSGKSSFIKLLVGEITQDKGNIFRSKTLDVSYFDQRRSLLNPDITLWETLCPNGGQDVVIGSGDKQKTMHVCGYLKKFLFDPSAAHDRVSTLSGGQQNRLLLAKILAQPGNLLILDEPTNDLDMETLDMLQDMLADYPGTLIVVSHDRDFLDRCVTEILAFEGDANVQHVFGGYSDYVREVKQRNAKKKSVKDEAAQPPASLSDESKDVKSAGLTYPEQIELKKLPEKIEQLQCELDAIQAQLDDAGLYEKNPESFTKLITDFDEGKQMLTTLEERWLELEERAMTENA